MQLTCRTPAPSPAPGKGPRSTRSGDAVARHAGPGLDPRGRGQSPAAGGSHRLSPAGRIQTRVQVPLTLRASRVRTTLEAKGRASEPVSVKTRRSRPVGRPGLTGRPRPSAPFMQGATFSLAAFSRSLAPVFSSLCCLGTDSFGCICSESAEFHESAFRFFEKCGAFCLSSTIAAPHAVLLGDSANRAHPAALQVSEAPLSHPVPHAC